MSALLWGFVVALDPKPHFLDCPSVSAETAFHIMALLRCQEFNELPALRRMRGLPPMACSPSPEAGLGSVAYRVATSSKSSPQKSGFRVWGEL